MLRRETRRFRVFVRALLAFSLLASPRTVAAQQLPPRLPGTNMVIGLEYAVLDNLRLVTSMATALSATGLTGMKHYVESVQWGEMQKSATAPVDFTKLDWFVKEYQTKGFTELTLSLKPHSAWGSKNVGRLKSTNAAPKPQYRDHFQRWVSAVIERYDGDGVSDMAGLRWPIRYVEIGNEFSSYEPEPVDEYLDLLKLAYDAAHRASTTVLVGHAAFLTTPVNMNVASANDYDAVWKSTRRVDKSHDLADMRKILDHPELFDFINLHNLGDPYEIEHQVRWLKFETGRRNYTKPIVISDTLPTSYAGWGAATVCAGLGLSVMVPPAVESDRCRLAAYFTKLVNKDAATLAWTRSFVAADQVQRTIIAAEQGIKLINLSFTSDIAFATSPAMRAGAGISAWGGAIQTNIFGGAVTDRFPLFYSIKQMMGYLHGYRSISRVPTPNAQARVYRVEGAAGTFWVAWRDPRGVVLPEDGAPSLNVTLPMTTARGTVEPVITASGQTSARPVLVNVVNGQLPLTLTHTPVYIK